MPAAATFSITELAAEFGVTTRTIRHYEEEGLIRPQRAGRSRVFSHRDRARLKLALLATRIGFTLGDVRELFDLHDRAQRTPGQSDAFMARLHEHHRRLELQRQDIQVMLAEIEFFSMQNRRISKSAATGKDDTGPSVHRQRNIY